MAVGTDTIGSGAGTITQGQRKLADINSSRKVPQWDGKTINISADTAPLSVFIDKLGQNKTVRQASFFHLETDFNPKNCAASTSYTTETTLVLASGQGARVVPGDILQVESTGEAMYVLTRSSDTITVTRSFGSTTIGNIASGEEIQIMGSAFAEGSSAPNGISSEPTIKTNYCQTFRAAFELSGRDIESENFGEDERERIKKMTAEAIMRQRETTFLFQNFVSASDPTCTGGVQYWLTTNVTNVAGALTESALETWFRGWMRRNYGSTRCIVMAGELFRVALNDFARDNIRYDPDDDVAGISIGTWQSTFGKLKVVPHGLLSPLGSGVSASSTTSNNNGSGGRQGYAFGFNMDRLGKRTYRNRDLTLSSDIETPGTDGKKWGYLMDCGLWLASEKQHGKMYGITG